MTWAATDIVPASISVNAYYSMDSGTIPDSVELIVAPLTSSGTKFDFTAATAANIVCVGNPSDPIQNLAEVNLTPSLVSHTSTGLHVQLTTANLEAIAAVGIKTGSITLLATDGTTVLIAGKGSLTINEIA